MSDTRPCNKRMPDNVFRCDLPRGHQGPHRTEWPDGKAGASWPNERDGITQRLRSNKRPQKETYEHELAEAFTDGIKADRILNQILTEGVACCVRCRRRLSRRLDLPIDTTSETVKVLVALALAEAMTESAKHHEERRRGHGYRPAKHGNDFGHDFPLLIEAPLCHRCHTGADSESHPGPQLGKATA